MIYFDNAATTFPKPNSVYAEAIKAMTRYGGNPGRSGHKMSYMAAQKVYSARETIARYFGADVENVVFCQNCTHALNMAVKGVMSEGGHAIASCLEHNSVMRPLNALKNKGKISFDTAEIFEDDCEKTVRSFASLIRNNTKLVICTAASNVSGYMPPVEKIAALAKAHGAMFVLDAAQTAGLVKYDINHSNIDILCCSGHKSLMGISGTGIMILKRGVFIDTLIEGGTGSVSVEMNQPDFSPDRYESGTLNTVGIFSLKAGIEFIRCHDLLKHERALCRQFTRDIKDCSDIVYKRDSEGFDRSMPVVSFNIHGYDSDDAVKILSSHGFALRGGYHCSPGAHRHYNTFETGAVRFSPGAFNSGIQVAELTKLIKKMAR